MTLNKYSSAVSYFSQIKLSTKSKSSDREHLDFDALYGKHFKITDNSGDPDAPGFSIVTPLNPGPWENWKERPEFKKIVKKLLNQPNFLDSHKYHQIIDSRDGKKFDPAKHLVSKKAHKTASSSFEDLEKLYELQYGDGECAGFVIKGSKGYNAIYRDMEAEENVVVVICPTLEMAIDKVNSWARD